MSVPWQCLSDSRATLYCDDIYTFNILIHSLTHDKNPIILGYMGSDAKLLFKFHWPKYKVIKHVDYRIQLLAVQQLDFE